MHNNSGDKQIEPTGDALTVKTNYIKRLEAFAKGAMLMVNSVDTTRPQLQTQRNKSGEIDEILVQTQRNKSGEIDEILKKYKNYLKEFELDIQSKNESNPEDAINQFYTNAASSNQMLGSLEAFVLELQKICGAKKFALSEAWVAWQSNEIENFDREKKELTLGNSQFSVQQTEKFLNIKLTDAQIQDINSVMTQSLPKWFTKLPKWAQNQFKKEFFDKGSFLQDKYQLYKPPTLRSVPGIVNTTKHELIVTVNGQTITTESYRQGVPVPYDMPDSEKLQQTIENFQQLINYHESHVESFWDLYGEEIKDVSDIAVEQGSINENGEQEEDLYGAPITHISLLSGGWGDSQYMWAIDSLHLDKDNNTEFLNLSRKALDSINSPTIASYNWPVNEQRPISPKNIDQKFIDQMKNRFNKMQIKYPDSPKTIALEKVIQSMEHHNDQLKRIPGRNPNLFAAALMMAAVRLSGGTVVSNCKSGKDREGAAILMADSIISYTFVNKEAPKFDDVDQKRKDFLDIQEQLYLDGAHQAVADRGSPGSGGLKDEGFFEKDFIARNTINFNFQLSRKIADFNKPEKKWLKIIVKDLTLLTSSLIGVVAIGVGIGLAASGVGLAIALPIIAIAAALWAFVAYMVNVPPKPLALPPKPPVPDLNVETATKHF